MMTYSIGESREVLAGKEHLTIFLKENAEELGEVIIIPINLETFIPLTQRAALLIHRLGSE
ncbi:hypothetical protein HC174_04055 [Salinimicrobium sp. CDJ15-81-2]|uniref:Uncharacterized protein n=2 Tax=Salinimicrobium oceani TaxID=2722702 RepID=A0ABX1D7D2_9FLAO|nr:hypothetical protein [Salinimicrobium oceani]NJY61930.1 hypothetical protein [Salinimicrobium nanhaiense]